MKKIDISMVALYSLSLFFIGISIFADKTTTIGIIITLAGYVFLVVASCISVIKLILKRKHKGRR